MRVVSDSGELVAPRLPLGRRIEFRVPGRVVPWARAGSHGGLRFTLGPQRQAIEDLRWYAKCAMRQASVSGLITDPVRLTVEAHYPIPASYSKKATWRAIVGGYRPHRPDADNILKLVSDALNRVAYVDDAQVVVATVLKLWSETPELRVIIEIV